MRASLILIACSFAAPGLTAQSSVGMEIASVRYGGSSRDTSGNVGRPGGGIGGSVRLDHRWKQWGAAVRFSYANPGFTAEHAPVSITDKSTGRLVEVAPLVSTRVGGIGPSGAVRVEVGPALHLWDFDGEYRKRLGGLAALVYEWPVVNRLMGSIRIEGSLSQSWFDAADVPPEFERHATWRYGVGLGLRHRLSGG